MCACAGRPRSTLDRKAGRCLHGLLAACRETAIQPIELGCDLGEAVARCATAGRRRGFSASRSLPSGAGTNSLAAFRRVARSSVDGCVRTWTRPRRRRGTYGLPASALSRSSTTSQPSRSSRLRIAVRAASRSPGTSSTTMVHCFLPGRRACDHPGRDHGVIAREALGCRVRRLLGRREQGVDPAEQSCALWLARREEQPVGGEERRDGQRVRVAQREVRKARQSRFEAVDDVERAVGQREREVGADADRRGHRARRETGSAGPIATTSPSRPLEGSTASRRSMARVEAPAR